MKQSRKELPTRLEAGGVCIQAEDWGETNVARIRFPKGADADAAAGRHARQPLPVPALGHPC